MKKYVLIATAALILAGCETKVERDCSAATFATDKYQQCVRESFLKQREAHRQVFLKYAEESK